MRCRYGDYDHIFFGCGRGVRERIASMRCSRLPQVPFSLGRGIFDHGSQTLKGHWGKPPLTFRSECEIVTACRIGMMIKKKIRRHKPKGFAKSSSLLWVCALYVHCFARGCRIGLFRSVGVDGILAQDGLLRCDAAMILGYGRIVLARGVDVRMPKHVCNEVDVPGFPV